MRALLLRPPRLLWPFNSDASAFWPPLGLLCLAAAVRRNLPDVQVEVWDCPGLHWGWRTLARRLAATRIDVLGIGDEAVSSHEALRAASLVKRLHPGCRVVAGGVYFAHAIPQTLATGCVDAIVRGEGELTLVELLRNLNSPASWPGIEGLAFRDGDGKVVVTPARDLIPDLDALPMPTWDLIDLSRYGRGSSNHPALVSIEHSRGCVDSCRFCILWKHMGRSANGNGRVSPHYRTKSPARSFEEVLYLYRYHGRRTFGWVDPTFNARPDWSDEWAERMLASPLVSPRGVPRTLHTAWLRADGIVRDEKLGILKKLVRAGLRQVVIGLERADETGLTLLGKHNNGPEVCREALAILRSRHPQVYTIGSLIFGLPGDTVEDLERVLAWRDALQPDFCFLIPLTPTPGTPIGDWYAQDGRSVDPNLAHHDFHTPVCPTDSVSRDALTQVYWRAALRPSRARLGWAIRNLLLARDARKRRVTAALVRHSLSVAARSLHAALTRSTSNSSSGYSRRPTWYNQ